MIPTSNLVAPFGTRISDQKLLEARKHCDVNFRASTPGNGCIRCPLSVHDNCRRRLALTLRKRRLPEIMPPGALEGNYSLYPWASIPSGEEVTP